MRPLFTILAATAVAACSAPMTQPSAPRLALDGIEVGADGRCTTRALGPSVTRVVTELVEAEPAVVAPDGTEVRPAIFRNVTRPVTTREGEGAPFETLCPQAYSETLVATLQRALIVRRLYTGPVTGTYDAATRAAVQAFQKPQGIDSPLLATRTAQDLGLLAAPQDG